MKYLRLFFLSALLLVCWVIAWRFNCDLPVLYQVSKVLRTDLMRVYGDNGSIGRFFYSPLALWMIQPMAHFTYASVKVFWIALQSAAFLLFWGILHRMYAFLKGRENVWGWIFIWCLAVNPLHNNFQSNNIQLILMAALLLAEVASHGNRALTRWGAGVLCGAAAAVKVFPLFIVVLYLLSRPKEVKYGILTAFALAVVLPFAAFGWGNGILLFRGFFENLLLYHADNNYLRVPDILCLPSMLTRWLVPALGESVARVAVPAVVLSIAAVYFAVARMSRRNERDVFAVGLALMVLLNPSTRVHYLIFVIPVFCSLLERVTQSRGSSAKAGWAALGVGGAFLALTTEGVVGKVWNDRFEFWSLPTIGMVLVCGFVFLLLVTAREGLAPISRRALRSESTRV